MSIFSTTLLSETLHENVCCTDYLALESPSTSPGPKTNNHFQLHAFSHAGIRLATLATSSGSMLNQTAISELL